MTSFSFFDGHNDFLYRYYAKTADQRRAMWLTGEGAHHLDLPRMQMAGFAGGFFAIWVPSPDDGSGLDFEALMTTLPYELPLPPMVEQDAALPIAIAQASCLLEMERLSQGALTVCRTGEQVSKTVANQGVAAIMHMEGAEAIGTDLSQLHLWHQMGLRSLGPVWSRPTQLGERVPISFP